MSGRFGKQAIAYVSRRRRRAIASDEMPLATAPNSAMPMARRRKAQDDGAAESGATRSLLRKTIKYPPPKAPESEDAELPLEGGADLRDERAIDLSFKRGGAGKTLKESPEARRYNTTTKDEEAKVSKIEARYVDGPVEQRPCKACSMFRAPGSCTKVEGDIDPRGHCKFWAPASQMSEDRAIALDRASVREIDEDGRLHVEITNISKATVNPYVGKEIPGHEELGLEPDKVYQLLRDPEELAKAASSFNKQPVLSVHVPVFAADYAEQSQKYTIGATGEQAEFVYPYLRNSLSIWDGQSIALIQSGEKKELSCGYHYEPDMTPGIYEGQNFDGVMRNIRGNHVAVVVDGRCGPDVVIGDSNDVIRHQEWEQLEKALLDWGIVSLH